MSYRLLKLQLLYFMNNISDSLQFKEDIDFLLNAHEFHEYLTIEEQKACISNKEYARYLVRFILEFRIASRTKGPKPHNWQGEGF